MPLTDVAIRKHKKPTKAVKMTDGKGLYLEVRPTGAKLWRYRYRLPDKHGMVREYLFAGGEYVQAPSGETKEQATARIEGARLTLEEARVKRAEWRGLVKQGIHPVHQQRVRRAEIIAAGANTFEAVAKRWIEKKGSKWTQRNRVRIERTLAREVYPGIGNIPIKSVSASHILAIMQRVEAAGAPTMAVLIRQWCYRIFNHAIANLLLGTNPAAGEIRDAVQPPKTRNHPALTPNDIPVLMERLKGYKGERTTVIALRLLLLTFVRSVELRGAEWAEFDLSEKLWRIPASRMKMRSPHLVPLSDQAVALLRELQKIRGEQRGYLFPNSKTAGQYMASTTLNAALVRLGYKYKFSPHGFRATASTMLNELGFRPDWIERQLAHKPRDAVRAIYNRAEHLQERMQMMQQWADVLDGLAKSDKKVIAGRFGKAA
jgi:integrase